MSDELRDLSKVLPTIPWDNLDTLKITWKRYDELQGEVTYSKFLPDIEIKTKDEVLP